jgi:protein-S-isoprenylcysteine O-methyltransferase Ste14
MISGVVLVLLAESMILRSWPHAEWAGAFLLINLIYIPLVEEPMLSARFGESYAAYTRKVPRFLPRLRPWRSGSGEGSRGR